MNIINNFLHSFHHLTQEMAPYLLLGFLMAGILKIVIPKELLYRHLAKGDFWSVLKASLLGVPLPICSCGVIPVAAHLKKEGARNGPILSFLTSTPTSGVDSLMATYSLMGPIFTFFRAISAFILGIASGVFSNLVDKSSTTPMTIESSDRPSRTIPQHLKDIFHYSFIELISDITKWLLIGIIAGALLGTFVPQDFVTTYLNSPIITYILMLIIGIPLYVCSTGSIPIAASFLSLGISPGAALVFLLVGPATNTATISFVAGEMGKKPLLIYILTILVCSLLIGIGFDLTVAKESLKVVSGDMIMLPSWIGQSSAIALYLLLGWSLFKKIPKKQKTLTDAKTFHISKMSCMNCVGKIEKALKENKQIHRFQVNLKDKIVQIEGPLSEQELEDFFKEIGYPAD